ncbi:MAG: 3D domain-containing protein [Syntrophales bacterium]|jgi:3D (Asp-Asp-Asp) domain-containing protein|nr:3D domain-containing protein [Syntrophales bacterium]MDY0043505.1 3D domain-containing protein [Syntrophales bacterium]
MIFKQIFRSVPSAPESFPLFRIGSTALTPKCYKRENFVKCFSILIISFYTLILLGGCCFFPKIKAEPGEGEVRRMLVTAYDAGPESCGWKKKYWCLGPPVYAYGPLKGKRKRVGITADGTKARKGTIAADPKYPFGTKMYVPGYGWGEVHDRGRAIKGEHIDIFFPDRDDALKWGKKYLNVIIKKP